MCGRQHSNREKTDTEDTTISSTLFSYTSVGKAAATRAGGRRITEVEATSGVIDDDTFGYTFPTFPLKRGIDRDDLGGKYLKSHWLMKSDLNFGHLFVLHIR
jgi:hypothetical protein